MNKKTIIIIFIVLLFATTIFFFITKKENITLNDRLEKIGKSFYTDFYFAEIEKNYTKKKKEEFLSKYKTIGIKVSLSNLAKYEYKDFDIDKELQYFDNNSCNKDETKVIIYPKKNYTQNDYKIKINLKCEK